mgnify:CR=1 FL=1
MRMYLQQFFPCLENRHVYPYRVIYPMMLEHIVCAHHHPRLQHFSKSWPSISNCWHDWTPNLSLPPIPPSCLPYPMQGFTTSMLVHLRRGNGTSWITRRLTIGFLSNLRIVFEIIVNNFYLCKAKRMKK